jgi:hypothetical protein
MKRRDLKFLLGTAGAFCLLRAAQVMAPPLAQLTWPTAPAHVLAAANSSRHLYTEIGKYSNRSVSGSVRVVLYEYERAGRTFRVRDEAPGAMTFRPLPATGDTVLVRVHPETIGRSVLWPRPPFHGVVMLAAGLLLLFGTWRIAREPADIAPESAR